jgi:predicted nucleic acid-binding protein
VICVDASVAAKWVLPEEHTDKALTLYHDTAGAREMVIDGLFAS